MDKLGKESFKNKQGLEEFKLYEYATIVDDLGQVRRSNAIQI